MLKTGSVLNTQTFKVTFELWAAGGLFVQILRLNKILSTQYPVWALSFGKCHIPQLSKKHGKPLIRNT
jgi:hypothetical protein